jgi:sporulation protein YlmC with PRC-barrel domain
MLKTFKINSKTTFFFNETLYLKVLEHKKYKIENLILDHELIGKFLVNKETKEEFLVNKVSKNWYNGNYITLHTKHDEIINSRTITVPWENISCIDEFMISVIGGTRSLYFVKTI